MTHRFMALLCVLALLSLPARAASPVGLAEVRGYVWHDVNENGLGDTGEQGLSNVLIILASRVGAMPRFTHTDNTGEYRFGGLAAGDYYVSETDPEGFGSTTPNLVSIEVDEGASVRQDFGDTRVLPGCWHAIDGYIWHDINANGKREGEEERLQGVSLRVLDLNNNLAAITASNLYGSYRVQGVAPERYYAILDAPDNMPFSTAPLYWGVDLRGCFPAIVDFGLQRHLEAVWPCNSPQDVVGPGNTLIGPDGLTDGSIRVWLNADSANPIAITQILVEVERAGQRQGWDTDPNTGDWVVGVVNPENNLVLNPEVTFQRVITGHSPLLLYISDVPGSPLLRPGAALTVTIQTTQGEPWVTSLSVPNCISPTLAGDPTNEGNSTVSGTVWTLEPEAGGTPTGRRAAPGVKLTLTDAMSNCVVAEQVSDSQGHYHFAGLAGWRSYYLAQGLLDGYEPVLSGYWGVAVTDDCDVIIDLENRPVPGGPAYQLYLPHIVTTH